jgi:hypothetical protein
MAGAYQRLAAAILADGTTEAVRGDMLSFAKTNEVLGLGALRPGAVA